MPAGAERIVRASGLACLVSLQLPSAAVLSGRLCQITSLGLPFGACFAFVDTLGGFGSFGVLGGFGFFSALGGFGLLGTFGGFGFLGGFGGGFIFGFGGGFAFNFGGGLTFGFGLAIFFILSLRLGFVDLSTGFAFGLALKSVFRLATDGFFVGLNADFRLDIDGFALCTFGPASPGLSCRGVDGG